MVIRNNINCSEFNKLEDISQALKKHNTSQCYAPIVIFVSNVVKKYIHPNIRNFIKPTTMTKNPKSLLFLKIEKCLEQGGGWLDIDTIDYDGSDDQSIFVKCESYSYIFEKKENIKFRFFYDGSAILAYDNEDKKNIVRYWLWGFSYQGLELEEIKKDIFRVFELNRKYRPKYMRQLCNPR